MSKLITYQKKPQKTKKQKKPKNCLFFEVINFKDNDSRISFWKKLSS